MLSETELREQYANLQQRALNLSSHGQSRIDQFAAAMQFPPKQNDDEYLRVLMGATEDATVALLSCRLGLPFLGTANSLSDREPREAFPVC
ncbi:hypothetical protein EVC45_33390 [Paraburkholderia sp. UYCP14C]|uniref:hypothetical protein n=1 Tax=Paraburkholderia sp. UYCP14C TaxID=2511130 RepID=UPI00101F07AE|nr:hypothetical protein [Paraburkholderia sp. UYCP14C]RZF25430.1 hypothetical protein EVC45_33390 [Paraburkholderia sp. UYCP14C]